MGLCTVAELSQWSTVPCPDGRAQLAIDDVSSRVERYCGRKFESATLTEKLQGKGSLYLLPSRWPVTAITSATIDGDAVTLADLSIVDYEGDQARAIYYGNGWPRPMVVATDLTSDLLRSEERNITLAYTGGHTVIPAEVKLVVIHEALLRLSDAGAAGLLRERMPGGWDQTYDRSDTAGGLSARSRAILDNYRATLYA